jgi:glutamine amidotransferase
MQQIAIIDYGSGNLHSAAKAFERAAREGEIDCAISVTNDPDLVSCADRVVLPGVGAFADCRAGLDGVQGMLDALVETVIDKGRPFCGICVGMQLMAARGLEHGVTKGFDWIGGDVVAIETDRPEIKIPHMGWNTLTAGVPHELFDGIPLGSDGWHAYFVHSYHLKVTADKVLATTEHGGVVTAAVGRDNMVGTQFHPEKSQRLGLTFISNFLRWCP